MMRQSPYPVGEAKARAVTWLTAWDSQGVHRTGTAGDEAGARWLAAEAGRTYDTETEDGRYLWDAVCERLEKTTGVVAEPARCSTFARCLRTGTSSP